MTADEIATIRNLRGCNVPWEVIAQTLGKTVQECRQAIGLPVYSPEPARPALPWESQQRTLFE